MTINLMGFYQRLYKLKRDFQNFMLYDTRREWTMTDRIMSRWKNEGNMETLDIILKELTAHNGEEWLKLHTNKLDFDTANAHMNYYEDIAKQKILDWYHLRKRQEAEEQS